ncbi:WecB/TagA/CpsF family glycosyltransferase, partial [Bacillus cereus]|nr:WecB/TagA/CpsF family glycosyltransferase [Bacillus cereus]
AKLSEDNKPVSVFLLGAKPHVVHAAADHLTKTYSAVSIAGKQDGDFKQEDEENIISRSQEAKPDVVLVAIGFPRQENFIQNHKHRLETKMAVGVGGSLDVWAGDVKRAPKWI